MEESSGQRKRGSFKTRKFARYLPTAEDVNILYWLSGLGGVR